MAKEHPSLMNEPLHDELAVCTVDYAIHRPLMSMKRHLDWHWDAQKKGLCKTTSN